MIPLAIVRKVLLFFAPLVFFYILRKIGKSQKRKPHAQGIDKSQIVEGEIISAEKNTSKD